MQAPELRLGVYEALLIAAEKTHKYEKTATLYPAVFRTSKQVCSEAMPILYKHNKFRATVECSEQRSWARPSGIMPVCTLTIYRPGGRRAFHHRMDRGRTPILRCLFENSATAHMLRMLTHLTIDLELVTPRGRDQESVEYNIKACNTVKSLCLAMAGASKIKELTISIKAGDQDLCDVDPADILWPLILLRSDITVKFKGTATDSEKKSITKGESSPDIDAAFCQRIALVKQLCNVELERPGWEDRQWAFHRVRDAEEILYDTKALGKKPFCFEDIVNMTPVWETTRREIDRAETLARANSEEL